jgi:hypothetical protein
MKEACTKELVLVEYSFADFADEPEHCRVYMSNAIWRSSSSEGMRPVPKTGSQSGAGALTSARSWQPRHHLTERWELDIHTQGAQ